MKFDRIKWNFQALLWEFLELRFYFKSEQPFEEYPWCTQIELQKVTAVLNAISGGDYIVETIEGKKEIEEAPVSDNISIGILKNKCVKSIP